MDEKQMLLMAAKAAGLYEEWPKPDYEVQVDAGGVYCFGMGRCMRWNPLDDDGDAFRLACKLKLNIAHGDYSAGVNDEGEIDDCALVRSDEERPEVLRLLIVRAAAQVGAGMRPFPTAEEIRRDWGGEGDTAAGEQSNG